MQKITSLHFPETIAQYHGFRQLLLFLDAITIFIPSEDSSQPEHLLVKSGLLNEQTPAPFGDHLKIFQRLVKDIQSHGSDFYGSYMSSLSAKTAIDVDENSVLELIKLMTPGNDLKVAKSSELDVLMQARLLLRLTEIKQHEERETREALAAFKSKKRQLLAALKGDDDDELELFPDLDVTPEPENPVRIKQRLKAWTELLLADNNTSDQWLATTGSPECFELLVEMEKEPSFPAKLFEIALPEFDNDKLDDQAYLQLRINFQANTANDRQALVKFLQTAAENPSKKEEDTLAETLKNWGNEVAQISPNPKTKLEFHLFNKPLPQLLKNACGIAHDKSQSPHKNTIIGVIR